MKPKLLLGLALVISAFVVPASAQEKTPLPAESTNVALWPTMDYSKFMAGHPDEAKRQQLWQYFLVVEREAKTFAGTLDHWKMLRTITLGTTGPKWFSNGRLQLGVNSDWAMFHEIFHNTFNGSQFHNGGDNAWSEAFCEAFRYMMEKKYVPEPRTKWFLKVDRYSNETYAQVMKKSGDKHFDQKYCYPGSLIVRKADHDPEKLRILWFELQKFREMKNTDVLNAYFGYNMQTGQPL
jgi:hypothetical protein